MNSVAIILGRAGSKGVPGKNSAPVAGRPCIEWTIDAARASAVERIVVSTDSPSLAAVARREGLEVIDRPPDLAADTATVDAALRHAVEALGLRSSASLAIVALYANVPVRPPGLIDRALDLLARTRCDSVQSFALVGKHHPWWMARLDPATNIVAPWQGDRLNHGVYRRQDLPPAFIPDGGVLAVQRRALFLEIPGVEPGPHAFFGLDRRGIESGEGEVIDIDSPADLATADAILRARAASPDGASHAHR